MNTAERRNEILNLLQNAPTFWVQSVTSICVYSRSWVRRGPVPPYDSVGLFRGLWTCLWVGVFLYRCMYMSCLGDSIRRGGRSAYVKCCFVGPVWPLLVFSACRVFGIVRKTKETLPKFFWKLSKFRIKPCWLLPYTRMRLSAQIGH